MAGMVEALDADQMMKNEMARRQEMLQQQQQMAA